MHFPAQRCYRPTRQQCHDGNEPKDHSRNPNNADYHRRSSCVLARIVHSRKPDPLTIFPPLPVQYPIFPFLIKYTDLTHKKTFLSMGFIHVESLGGLMKLNVTQDMWFYLAITVPLMVLTFLAWGVWEWIVRRRTSVRMVNGKGNV
jgi:hypothetical protein